MKKQSRRKFIEVAMAGVAGAMIWPAAARAGEKNTLNNLLAAYDGESNAQARYLAFAKKADEEGYTKVASLFRAAARSEEAHLSEFARVVKKMGGAPKAEVKTPEVKSTKENLEAAIKAETYESETWYPECIALAHSEGNKEAKKAFNYSKAAETDHVGLFTDALAKLEEMKGGTLTVYVCTLCGSAVLELPEEKCPTCFEPLSKFTKVI